MGHDRSTMTAVLLALLSATSFAVSTVTQHRAATACQVRPGRGHALRLAARLVRTPAWLAGQLAAATGFVLHGVALRFGPVTLVQPVLSCGLVLTLALGALVDRRHPDRPLPHRRQWLAAAVVVAGVVLFILTAHPQHGSGRADPPRLLLAACATLALIGLAWTWASRPERPHRALALGIAAGTGFGMTGTLLKQVVHQAPTSWAGLWPLLLMVLVGACSIVSAQSAYQAGHLIESLPPLTVLEPVIAAGIASFAFGEALAPGLLAHTGQVLGLLLLAGGVIDLARRPTSVLEEIPLPVPP
jgi:drug/metabolite transporter (DMT)-like permease